MEEAAEEEVKVSCWSKRQMWTLTLLAILFSPLVASLLYNLPLFCTWASYTPESSLVIVIPLLIAWIGVVLYTIGWLAVALVRHHQQRSRQALQIGVVAAIMLTLALTAFDFQRIGHFSIVSQGEKLVSVLDQYKAKTGSYPGDLEELEKEYLADPWRTGSGAFPKFQYSPTPHGREFSLWIPIDSFQTVQFDRRPLAHRRDYPGKRLRADWYLMPAP